MDCVAGQEIRCRNIGLFQTVSTHPSGTIGPALRRSFRKIFLSISWYRERQKTSYTIGRDVPPLFESHILLRCMSVFACLRRTILCCFLLASVSAGIGSPLLAYVGDAASEPPILTFTGPNIEWVFSADQPGPYNRLYDRILDESGITAKFMNLPFRRAVNAFRNKTVDCFFMGSNDLERGQTIGLKASEMRFIGPFNTYRIQAFTRPEDAEDISSFASLAFKKVAVDTTLAAIFPKLLRLVVYDYANTELKVRAIANGDIDVLVGYDYDLRRMVERMGLADRVMPARYVMYENQAGITCQNTAAITPMLDKLQHAADRLRSSGEIQKILDLE